MPLNANDIVQLASQLQAIGVARIKWGEIELEFHGGMSVEPVESVPLTNEKPPDTAYDRALLRMAKKC